MELRCPICKKIIGSPYIGRHHQSHGMDRKEFIKVCGMNENAYVAEKIKNERGKKDV